MKKSNSILHKVLALILALMLTVNLVVPAMAANTATDDTVYVLAASDFQAPNGPDTGAVYVTNILNQMKVDHPTMNGFLFEGDYDYDTHNNVSQTNEGITTLMRAVQGAYSGIDYDNTILVQGNHDYMDPLLAASGANDTDSYGVYVIHEDEYMDCNSVESTIKLAGAGLEAYLNAKVAAGYDKPIFVVSHLPLHFGSRTIRNGDAKYAHYLFDPMNEAGKAGLNIIYLYGHDHAYGYDNYLGGHAVYLPKGDKIYIAKSGSQSSFTEETLAFTYLNAGYTGYYSDTGSNVQDEALLTMTVFAITDTTVTVSRYNKNGEYKLKNAGVKNGTFDSAALDYQANTTEYPAGCEQSVITLTRPKVETVTDPATGISVTSQYTSEELDLSVTSGVTVSALGDTEKYADYEAYTISTAAAVSGSPAYISIPVPDDYPMDHVKVYLAEDAGLTDMKAAVRMVGGQKRVVFFTTEPGTYAVACLSADEAEACYVYRRVESDSDLVSGEQYLIVLDYSINTDGDLIMTTTPKTGGTGTGARTGFETVTLSGNAAANIPVTDTYEDYEWTLSQNGDGDWIIGAEGGSILLTYNSYTSRYELSYDPNGTAFRITSTESEAPYTYRFSTVSEVNGGIRYFDYNTQGLINGYASTSPGTRFYIFRKTDLTRDVPVGSTGVWTEIQKTGTQYRYVLDTDGYETDSENRYLIVGSNDSVALSSQVPDPVDVLIADNTILMDTRDNEWYIVSSTVGDWASWPEDTSDLIVRNDSVMLDDSGMKLNTTDTPAKWLITHDGTGRYNFKHAGSGSYWYMYYDGSDFGVTTSSGVTVRLFKYDTRVELTDEFAKIEGEGLYTFDLGTTADEALAAVQEGIAGYSNSTDSDTGMADLADSELTWIWADAYDADTPGCYTVQVSYKGRTLGTAEVQVVRKYVSGYSLDSTEGYVPLDAAQSEPVLDASGSPVHVITAYTDGTTDIAVVTVDMLSYNGAAVSTAAAGTLSSLTVTCGEQEVSGSFTLKVLADEPAVIAEGWSGYTIWTLTEDGVLTVSPSGQTYNGKVNMRNYWKQDGVLSLPWGEYAEQITAVVVEEGVNAIGQMAFYGLPNLTSVTLPSTATEIRNYAFKNCVALTEVDLGEGLQFIREGAFYGCTALTTIEIPESVTEIGEYAFSHVPGYVPAN